MLRAAYSAQLQHRHIHTSAARKATETFGELFRRTPLHALDTALAGVHVEGVIVANEPDRVVVDLGLKLNGILLRKDIASMARWVDL